MPSEDPSSYVALVDAVEEEQSPSEAKPDEPEQLLWYDAFDKLLLGRKQSRDLKISTACDGINAPIFALKQLGVRYDHIYG